MSYYEDKIFPAINEFLTTNFDNHRKKILKSASGEIVEIGFGSGVSVKAYPATVTKIVGIEPFQPMIDKWNAKPEAKSESRVNVVKAFAEDLPFENGTFDAASAFMVLCSVTNVEKVLSEIKRVLKPGGKLYFIEHMGHERGTSTRKLQNAIEPLWNRMACGCHITRETLRSLKEAGFQCENVKVLGYSGFPNFLSPVYRGIARLPS